MYKVVGGDYMGNSIYTKQYLINCENENELYPLPELISELKTLRRRNDDLQNRIDEIKRKVKLL